MKCPHCGEEVREGIAQCPACGRLVGVPHWPDGQNVLFLDSHVEFAKQAFCSVEDDNIYTVSGRGPDRADPQGTPPTLGSQPANRKDSLLVNDPVVP